MLKLYLLTTQAADSSRQRVTVYATSTFDAITRRLDLDENEDPTLYISARPATPIDIQQYGEPKC